MMRLIKSKCMYVMNILMKLNEKHILIFNDNSRLNLSYLTLFHIHECVYVCAYVRARIAEAVIGRGPYILVYDI